MLDFVIIGAAQSGLSMAYHLKKLNKSFLILDKDNEIGASWLKRWDSLTLFTPTEFNHMEGLDFPQPEGHYPSKYEVAAYLKLYAATNFSTGQRSVALRAVRRIIPGNTLINNNMCLEDLA